MKLSASNKPFKKPVHGEQRKVKRFAFFPVRVYDENTKLYCTIWLEAYIDIQKFSSKFENLNIFAEDEWESIKKFIPAKTKTKLKNL